MTPGSFALPPPSDGPELDELNPTDVLLMWWKFTKAMDALVTLPIWQEMLFEQASNATHALLIRTSEIRERGLLK
jgi:hypothetical protein